ncbi:hypothetical protein [Maribacter sp. 2307ULW6-5]|uniref:hypothetical protein n=1 Tax=Maribacter sp. 2307ULW6-5 TaxID=3386275 RepID=UPI0039BCB7F1
MKCSKNKKINTLFIDIVFLTLVFNFGSVNSQCDKLSKDEYKVINDYYSKLKVDIPLYHRTYFDKAWVRYFENTENIFGAARGIPTTITDGELRVLLDDISDQIATEIIIGWPCDLKQSELTHKLKIVESFDSKDDIKNGVRRISKPIIVDDIAVIKLVQRSSISIHILQKQNRIWEPVYSFNEWFIIE